MLGGAIGATGVGAITTGTALTVPSLLGFSASGIVAHRLAAAWQRSIGNVAAQSVFASLQAFSATAPLAPVLGPVLVVAGMVAAGGAFVLALDPTLDQWPRPACLCPEKSLGAPPQAAQ